MRAAWWDSRLRDGCSLSPGAYRRRSPRPPLPADVPAFRESLEDLRASTSTWHVWCVRRHGRLVASVRARAHGSTWHVGRLMVAPDQAGNGIGSWLLSYAEGHAPTGTTHCALFTGHRSTRNIALYQRAGYVLTTTAGIPDGTVYLTKQLQETTCASGVLTFVRGS